MYKTTKEDFGRHQLVTLHNTETGEYFSIIPECGAKVQQIGLKKGLDIITILDSEKDPNIVSNDNWHKGEFLIPFPNRIKSGEYEFNSEKYKFDINMPEEGNAIHGIMFSKSFALVSENNGSLVCEYKYEGTDTGYPFLCTVSYKFSLTPGSFSCEIGIKNDGKETLPLGVGWHPYFSLDVPVDQLELMMPLSKSIGVDEKMIPTGEKFSFDDYNTFTQIYDTGFDTGFEIINKEIPAVTSIRYPEKDLLIELIQTTGVNGFNYVQVFTPPGRKTIALEPMTCPADAFNSKESLIELQSGNSWLGNFTVTLK